MSASRPKAGAAAIPLQKASVAALNVRLAAVEATHGEILLGLQHSVSNQSTAITLLQADMHKLVQLNEQQILLAERAAQSSQAIERAHVAIKESRVDLVKAIETMDTNWTRWRDAHEAANAVTAEWASSAKGGIKVLASLGVVLWALLGWLALDWRGDLKNADSVELEARQKADAAAEIRLQAVSDQVQEIRIKRDLEVQTARSPAP